MLAVMTSDIGNLRKLFSEAIETADRKPVEGVVSTGGSKVHGIRFGLLPQVLPVIASQVLYFFESNTRSSTIIGIVGAGGIGLHLAEQIRTLEWQAVAFIILLILVAVAVIDCALRPAAPGDHRRHRPGYTGEPLSNIRLPPWPGPNIDTGGELAGGGSHARDGVSGRVGR